MEIRLDDGSYQCIDEFDLEWRDGQQVFVGNQSGQVVAVGAGPVGLTYDLAALVGNSQTAQIRIVAEVGCSREILEIDDVSMTGTRISRDGDGVATTTLASGALLTVGSDGSFSYDPNGAFDALAEGEQASDSFTYTVADESDNRNTATATVHLTGTNDAPVAIDDTAAAREDSPPIYGSVASNDSDVDNGAALTFSLDVAVPGLSLDPDGSYIFDPGDEAYQSLAQDEVVQVVAAYTVTDEHGASDDATLTIEVTGLNDVPTALDDDNQDDFVIEAGSDVDGDASATGNVLINDSDVDLADVLTVAAVDGVAGNVGQAVAGIYGTVTIDADGGWTYTLDDDDTDTEALAAGETVVDSFDYSVSDGQGGSATATLRITIDGTDDSSGGINVADLDGSNGFVINGKGFSNLGFSLASAGDVNNDGYDDLILGAEDHTVGAGVIVYGGPDVGSTGIIAAADFEEFERLGGHQAPDDRQQ